MKKTYLILSILFLAIISSSLTKDKTQSNIEKEFSGINTIDISTVSGNCKVLSHDSQNVKVILKANYKPKNTFEPVFVKENDKLILNEKMTDSNSGNSDWTILVPENIGLQFNSASGSIDLENVRGKIYDK